MFFRLYVGTNYFQENQKKNLTSQFNSSHFRKKLFFTRRNVRVRTIFMFHHSHIIISSSIHVLLATKFLKPYFCVVLVFLRPLRLYSLVFKLIVSDVKFVKVLMKQYVSYLILAFTPLSPVNIILLMLKRNSVQLYRQYEYLHLG